MDNYITTLETDFDTFLKNGNFSLTGRTITNVYNGGLGATKVSSRMPLIEYEVRVKSIGSPTLATEYFYMEIDVNVWTQALLNTSSKQALKECLWDIENAFKENTTFLNKFGIPTKVVEVNFETDPLVFPGVVGWGMTIGFNGSNAL